MHIDIIMASGICGIIIITGKPWLWLVDGLFWTGGCIISIDIIDRICIRSPYPAFGGDEGTWFSKEALGGHGEFMVICVGCPQ